LIKIGGSRIVKGGNSIVDGVLNDDKLKYAIKVIKKRGFSHEIEVSSIDLSLISRHANLLGHFI
jgi:hypothetical protein